MKVIIKNEYGYIIAGSDREVRSLYTNLLEREIFSPVFCEFPKFRKNGFYGIHVTCDGSMSIVNSDTICYLLTEGGMQL